TAASAGSRSTAASRGASGRAGGCPARPPPRARPRGSGATSRASGSAGGAGSPTPRPTPDRSVSDSGTRTCAPDRADLYRGLETADMKKTAAARRGGERGAKATRGRARGVMMADTLAVLATFAHLQARPEQDEEDAPLLREDEV